MAAYGIFIILPTQPILITLLFMSGHYFVAPSTISDLRKCADKSCSVTISRATVLARHPASSPLHLSLNKGDIVEIKSKSAGISPELWGGEVNGRRGYFSKAYVREFQIFNNKPLLEVPTEENSWSKQPSLPRQPQQKQPPPPPTAADVVKDETEIDETDLTNMDDTLSEKKAKPSIPPGADAIVDQLVNDETETDQAQKRNPLLQRFEELQKSFMMMEEIHHNAEALNDFLARRFGSEDAAFASAPAPADTNADKTQSSKDSATEDSETKVPEVGPDIDETDIDDNDAQPIPADMVEQDSVTKEPQVLNVEVEIPEEKEDDSPYIPGVRELEVEEVDEESEKMTEKQESTDNIHIEVASVNEIETVVHMAQATKENEEALETTRQPHKGDSAQVGDKLEMFPSSKDSTLESETQNDVEQVLNKAQQESSAASSGQTHEQEATEDVRFHFQNMEQEDVATASKPEGFAEAEFVDKSVEAGGAAAQQQKDEDQLAVSKPEEKDEKKGEVHKTIQNEEKEGAGHHAKHLEQPGRIVEHEGLAASANHQPVDIDFVAERLLHSDFALESSQDDHRQPVQIETPALDGTSHQKVDVPDTAVHAETQNIPLTGSESIDQNPTTMIDGTRFYLSNGEIADIVPESIPPQEVSSRTSEISISTVQVTHVNDVQATAQPAQQSFIKASPSLHVNLPDPTPGATNGVQKDLDSLPNLSNTPQIDDRLRQDINLEQYQTNADFLTRKVLSVNSETAKQIPTQAENSQKIPAQEPVMKNPAEQQSNTAAQKVDSEKNSATAAAAEDALPKDETLTSQIEPSISEDVNRESVAVAVNQPPQQFLDEDYQKMDVDQEKNTGEEAATTASEPVVQSTDTSSHLKSAETSEATQTKSPELQNAENQRGESVTPSTDQLELGHVPPPPFHDADKTTSSSETQAAEEPTLEDDPYQMDDYYNRKITDEELSKAEAEAASYSSQPSSSSLVRSLEAHSKAFIEKLPPSLQSLLEQEPLGLSPGMTVMVTMTALVIFLSVTCFSCLCSSNVKKTGTKDPLVVVRDLEKKLLMAIKEKENLEDMLQDQESRSKRLKSDFSDIQSKHGSSKAELQNVSLHNEVLKNQITTLQAEIAELQDLLSRKTDDVRVKDKKTKDIEKETKKLQEAKQKLEQNLQKKENECQRLGDENENLKTTIQSLTDQVQLLDTSKQQLLSEAEDWKEKVDELKERQEQLEQENRQAQETISFKENELEMMKDCYLQLKSLEKGSGEEEEDFNAADSKALEEKIQAMMDVSKVNATLRAVQEEKDSLDNKLQIEWDARRELEEQLQCVRREMESSMADKMKAERQCQEAQTKLTVLTAYFKDKEIQLQRELGEQEALKKQNLSKLDNADENTRTMQKELELSKQQVESLKRELMASERDFRSQIAANEKKAHENWINARAAERELKETRHEAAMLRQKLTEVERRHMESGGLIRPLPTRGIPPPGMMNGPPPPPGMERSPSRGSLPPGVIPPHPPYRDGEFPLTPRELERLPPSHPARHMPPPEPRSPPPRMLPPDARGSPPRMLPPDVRSPPPYDRRGPPHPMNNRSPPMRLPHPDMVPPMRGPFPPHMGPLMGSPGLRMDSHRDHRQGASPYGRQPPPGSDSKRHQSHV